MKAHDVKSSKKFTEILKGLEERKADSIQAMIRLSFSKLYDLKKYYGDWAADAAKDGHKESAAVNAEKWRQVTEAIAVKTGNEEQAWDMLT